MDAQTNFANFIVTEIAKLHQHVDACHKSNKTDFNFVSDKIDKIKDTNTIDETNQQIFKSMLDLVKTMNENISIQISDQTSLITNIFYSLNTTLESINDGLHNNIPTIVINKIDEKDGKTYLNIPKDWKEILTETEIFRVKMPLSIVIDNNILMGYKDNYYPLMSINSNKIDKNKWYIFKFIDNQFSFIEETSSIYEDTKEPINFTQSTDIEVVKENKIQNKILNFFKK